MKIPKIGLTIYICLFVCTVVSMEKRGKPDIRIVIPENNLTKSRSIKTRAQMKQLVQSSQQSARKSGNRKEIESLSTNYEMEFPLFKQYVAEEMFGIKDSGNVPKSVEIIAKQLQKNPESHKKFLQYLFNKEEKQEIKTSRSASETQSSGKTKAINSLKEENNRLSTQINNLLLDFEKYKKSKEEAGQVLMQASGDAYKEKQVEANTNFKIAIITGITTLVGPLITYFITANSATCPECPASPACDPATNATV